MPASYRIVAVVDALGPHTETSEGNNTLATSSAVLMTPYLPDLTVPR